LEKFGNVAGSAVALHFCVQGLIVSVGGTLAVICLQGDTAWPLVTFSSVMAIVVLTAREWASCRSPLPA
jgi:DHA1 family florfenicol/chloramphenicol resistance protein-like MFS transporter